MRNKTMRKKTVIILALSVLFVGVLIAVALIFPRLTELYEKSGKNPAGESSFGGSQNKISATDFTVYDTSGNEIRLSDKTGKPTVVNFWATWCGYCVNELPDFDVLYKEYGNKVNFMMVDLPDGQRETESAARSFIKNHGYSFPVYFDLNGSASKAYVDGGIPVTVFVDKEGNILEKHIGMMHETSIREYLEKMVGEQHENKAQ